MTPLPLRLAPPARATPQPAPRFPIGRFLVDTGVITSKQLIKGLHLQLGLQAPLGEILVAQGWATPDQVQAALAQQFGIARADLVNQPPDPALSTGRPAAFWLHHRVIPWTRVGGATLIATARPDRFETLREKLADSLGPLIAVQASEGDINRAIADRFRAPLARAAGTRVAARYSCRDWHWSRRLVLPLIALWLIAAVVLSPALSLGALSVVAISTLVMFAALKLAAALAQLTGNALLTAPNPDPSAPPALYRRPKVSVLVPLYREREIIGDLIARLMRLTYPKALLDVVLVLEERDEVTRRTLAETELPSWIRVIEVPADGALTTKPRAMNYALDFCDGDIIGVWDAEDAPASDQIERVAERFATAPPDVVCLQGILDYYNPRSNWLARCFTVEYSAWFRVILPGLARLGLVVPLGGTTLFFRRDRLEELGGWDAHNVTEDADLGMRLCRRGWRTEMIDTVTYEEANCRPWPWIKQRSRWLKGFLVTYLVHMRRPVRLLRDLGFWRFLSFQAFFLGTLGQFLLAPVLWSYWLFLLGLGHPVDALVPVGVIHAATALFVFSEILAIAIGLVAVSKADRRFLMPWVPTLILYFPLGTVAAFKALYELAAAPYFWDKTQHGLAGDDTCPHGAATVAPDPGPNRRLA